MALDMINRTIPFLPPDARGALEGSVGLARKCVDTWGGESLQTWASKTRIDASTLGAVAELLVWRLHDEWERRNLRALLRQCSRLCVALLYRQGAAEQVREICHSLDAELMVREVRQLGAIQREPDERFEHVRRVICTGGTVSGGLWRQRWYFADLAGDEEEAAFVWDQFPFAARSIVGPTGTVVRTLAADPSSAKLARSIARVVALQTLSAAFVRSFPGQANELIGAARMLVGVDSSTGCDFCSDATPYRRWPRFCCAVCRESVDAAVARRTLDPNMLVALAARALEGSDARGSAAALRTLQSEARSRPRACRFCGSGCGEDALSTSRGVICRRCIDHARVGRGS